MIADALTAAAANLDDLASQMQRAAHLMRIVAANPNEAETALKTDAALRQEFREVGSQLATGNNPERAIQLLTRWIRVAGLEQ